MNHAFGITKPNSGKWITILFIQILCGMEMDLFIPSFPELQRIFDLTPFVVQLTVSVNFVLFCLCSLYVGTLGDRYDRRQVLLAGLICFILGSLLCVIAPNFSFLVAGRALQGIGIAAPAVLSFPILLDDYPLVKQASVMGMINGIKTLSMAIAPLIGSWVNLFFSWRGNFSLLLAMGIVAFVASAIFVPSKKGNAGVSISLKAYLPFLSSQQFLVLSGSIVFLTAIYWVFMAMAPILYMESLGVSLAHFGWYQGALSLTFAMVSILSPKLYHGFGQKNVFNFGVAMCFISALLILVLCFMTSLKAGILTGVMILFSVGIVFPINVIFPLMLRVVPDASARAAGLGQAILLLMTAVILEFVAYFYNQKLMSLGLTMFVGIMLSLFLIWYAKQKKLLPLFN